MTENLSKWLLKMLRFITIACLLVAIQGAVLPKRGGLLSHYRRSMGTLFPGRIVGGSAISIDQAPWQVALEDGGYLFCGGSIISANYILTAAHCTDGTPARYISVRSGTAKLQSGGTVTTLSSLAQNPGFSQNTLDSDVSVLKLSKSLSLGGSSQQAVTLSSSEPSGGQTAKVTGWGALTDGGSTLPSTLQSVSLPIVSRTTCNSAYGGDITARMICAGSNGKDSCQGDSGGPLTVGNAQAGIVSWGIGCARPGYYGVYANVAALKSFINQNSNNEAQWS